MNSNLKTRKAKAGLLLIASPRFKMLGEGLKRGTYAERKNADVEKILGTLDFLDVVFPGIVYEKEEMLHLADGFQDSRLERMLDFMKSNLGRRLTLEQVASAGFVSLREASRLFERHLSSSPMKFFLSMRLEKARSLLERGDLPMADICQQTGFESVSHFSTSFRKAYSVTPSEYRSRFR